MREFVVTGVGSGVGAELMGILSQVPNVLAIGLDHRPEELNRLNGRLPGSFELHQCDLRKTEDRARFRDERLATLEHPFALINNAGIYLGRPFEEYPPSEVADQFAVNVLSCLEFTAAFAKAVRQRNDRGYVVNIASTAGEIGSSDSVYGASKAAVIGATKSQAMNYADCLNVNCVSPGLIHETAIADRIPQYRLEAYTNGELVPTPMTPRTVAQFIVAVASPTFQHMTGKVLPLDNGTFQR